MSEDNRAFNLIVTGIGIVVIAAVLAGIADGLNMEGLLPDEWGYPVMGGVGALIGLGICFVIGGLLAAKAEPIEDDEQEPEPYLTAEEYAAQMGGSLARSWHTYFRGELAEIVKANEEAERHF